MTRRINVHHYQHPLCHPNSDSGQRNSGTVTPDPLLPPMAIVRDGSASLDQFVAIGEAFVNRYLLQRANLLPAEKVLDVGCGIGQKARPLSRYLTDKGSYDGFDILKESISWCQEAYRQYSNFHFAHVDIYNSHYNPEGIISSNDLIFPYGDQSFDVVLLASVFTHMLPEGVIHYMHEVSRVLRPGGRSIITYFLLNQDSMSRRHHGKATINVPYVFSEGCRVADLNTPETTVAHDEGFLRGLYADTYQQCADISYGYWCGRKELVGALQDVIISIRE